MLTIVPKWCVSVRKSNGVLVLVWVHALTMSEVLRKIADIQFDENGLQSPSEMNISLVPPPTQTTASFT